MGNVYQDDFSQLEHRGWSEVAELYDSTWSNLTRQFIDPVISKLTVIPGMKVLDLACGPGYLSEALRQRGVEVRGLDFSSKMISVAKRLYPAVNFMEGDAQQLAFEDAVMDAVVMNFGMLHLSRPEVAIHEAWRVLKTGGAYVFTVWAGPDKSPVANVMLKSIRLHADMNVNMPEAPDSYLFSNEDFCREIVTRAGFRRESFTFSYHEVWWTVPTSTFLFDTEFNAGVRTAALLKRQTKERLKKIRDEVAAGMEVFFDGNQYRLPFCGCMISAAK